MIRIGDFSKLAQVSVKTLRHYGQLGLLKPSWVDRFTGYRYYTLAQLPQLYRRISKLPRGQAATLSILRRGRPMQVQATPTPAGPEGGAPQADLESTLAAAATQQAPTLRAGETLVAQTMTAAPSQTLAARLTPLPPPSDRQAVRRLTLGPSRIYGPVRRAPPPESAGR